MQDSEDIGSIAEHTIAYPSRTLNLSSQGGFPEERAFSTIEYVDTLIKHEQRI